MTEPTKNFPDQAACWKGKSWEGRIIREMIHRAMDRDPEITTAQLTLRFGISCGVACKERRAWRKRHGIVVPGRTKAAI